MVMISENRVPRLASLCYPTSCYEDAWFGLAGCQHQSYLPERMFLLHKCGAMIGPEASFEISGNDLMFISRECFIQFNVHVKYRSSLGRVFYLIHLVGCKFRPPRNCS